MQIVNFAPASVGTGGGIILSSAQANALTAKGMNYVGINPSVDVVLVDPTLGQNWADVPGATAGTVANSPWTCPANVVTNIEHRGGAVYGISTSGTATVKFSGALA